MLKEEIKNLFSLDKIALPENGIDEKHLEELDSVIFKNLDEDNILPEVISIYKKFQPMKQNAPEPMKKELFNTLRNYAKSKYDEKNYTQALIIYRFLAVKENLIAEDYINIATATANLYSNKISKYFANLYYKKEENKPLAFILLGDLYKNLIKDNKSAIKYYEKFLEINKTKASVYNIVADLYSKEYGDEKLEEQIRNYQKAFELNPSGRLSIHGLAFAYEKIGNNEQANYYYKKLLENNPTKTDFFNYGMFLIHCGDFVQGHKYIKNRFELDNINLKYPSNENKKWDLQSNIYDKTLLVHYEQGFGDTIMYCRFLPQLKQKAKKLIFVVQEELYDLIKNSPLISDEIKIVTSENDIEYDQNMALLDAPYVLKTKTTSIPYAKRYLMIPQEKIEKFHQNYIRKNNKIKVGIAYTGDRSSNYNDRNIALNKFNVLFGLKNAEFYYLQKEPVKHPGLINLGESFKDFTDTACAICCMDLIVSTDNVILNLAGALGKKTIALFNKETNYRWFKTKGKNVGWYNSVKPIQAEKQNDWDGVLLKVMNTINKL